MTHSTEPLYVFSSSFVILVCTHLTTQARLSNDVLIDLVNLFMNVAASCSILEPSCVLSGFLASALDSLPALTC